ncbi:hypothetical protein WJX74_008584 [Apatococcus lobatus]|uniref:BFN domain-containing protein n=1 Tax=Apatococcus lobatus TaxID=904363 RepID=A0AAW1QZ73_9CHLO
MQTLSRLGPSALTQPALPSANVTPVQKSPSLPSKGTSCPVRLVEPQKTATLEQSSATSSSASDLGAVQRSRRDVAFGGLLSLGSLFLVSNLPAHASVLRSQRSDRPCALTVQNNGLRPVKLFWINYDGDLEFYGAVPGGGSFTIDTFETHPWRLVDASSNSTLQEFTATGLEQVVNVGEALPEILAEREARKEGKQGEPVVASRPHPAGQSLPFAGFDGVGGSDQQYASAQLTEVLVDPNGSGLASLAVDGYGAPVSIYVGLAEAAAILYASGMESRRPSTISTWQHTIEAMGAEVQRVLVTRLVGHTYYARIVVSLPGGSQQSVDARPSDSLALALQCAAPVFVSKDVAKLQQAREPGILGPKTDSKDGTPLQQLGPGNHPDPTPSTEAGLPA